jgi:hypothetical protein
LEQNGHHSLPLVIFETGLLNICPHEQSNKYSLADTLNICLGAILFVLLQNLAFS